MKRHIAWLMACGVLAGCASEPSPIDAPPAPTASNQANEHSAEVAGSEVGDSGDSSVESSADAPAAFHFKSGTLEIGDFDPYTLGDDIFDPCTEISPEEFAAAGFHNVEPIPEEYAGLTRGLSACEIKDERGRIELSLMNNNADRQYIEDSTGLIEIANSKSLPEAFAYGPRGGVGDDCYVQLDTHRGGIVVIAPGSLDQNLQEQNCVKAFQALEEIFSATQETFS
ncbi:DUF3558 family protein [Corynebacterium haemomassiliense]|uniref:DUF3558 family protein n=1 Tax=Corynebacterium haemomassiliense TaxID=2754726 RepID=A0A7W2E8X5_9CORY|nr:DUF3558 family protein [Corynebacterium haemomassiliense]MBA5243314.1 DUF3558 family protein [Corynebacterium haemomassiliense]